MKILLAPDSFKGTLTSLQVIHLLSVGCRTHFPDAEIIQLPMADGGEGTVDAFVSALGYDKRTYMVRGPLGASVEACIGLKDETAVIEMAQASGLGLIAMDSRNPLITSTFGTGELISRALDAGAKKILIGIGGSATNDGGMGMASALGFKFLDSEGQALEGCGKNLIKVAMIDDSLIDSRLKNCEIVAICDVTNPLTGPLGATRVYGPQKGAGPEMVVALEQGMVHYKHHLEVYSKVDADTLPGSGAAGGLGAALAILLGGRLMPGIDAVLEAVRFDELVKGVDFIITGEGRLDEQSAFGKVPYGIGRRCKDLPTKVFVLAGSISGNLDTLYENGIDGVYPIISEPCTLDEALRDPEQKMSRALDNLLRLIKALNSNVWRLL